jgi:hypothetical protein
MAARKQKPALAQADRVVAGFLAAMSDASHFVREFSDLSRQVALLGHYAIPPIVRALRDDRVPQRIAAAWYILHLREANPRLITEPDRALAVEVINRALQVAESEELFWACTLLSNGAVPQETVPLLKPVLEHRSTYLQVCAAAGLSGQGPLRGRAVIILGKALQSDADHEAVVAAKAFARLMIRVPDSVQRIMRALSRADAASSLCFMHTLRELGDLASPAADTLAGILRNEKEPLAVRRVAAGTLGAVAGQSDWWFSVLMEYLDSPHDELFAGVIEGVFASGRRPQKVVVRVFRLLEAPDEHTRLRAVAALVALRITQPSEIRLLVKRAESEESVAVRAGIIDVIAASGETALPVLIELLRAAPGRMSTVVPLALVELKAAAAEALAPLLEETDDPVLIGTVVGVLRELGPYAAPIVPQLVGMLDETEDEEMAACLLAILFACGRAAAGAVPALIRCLSTRDEQAAHWAARVIWMIGPDAMSSLEEAAKTATDEVRRRMDQTLAGIRAIDDRRFVHLERLQRDDLLELFVAVAEVLGRGTMTWPEISEELEKRKRTKVKTTTVRTKIKALGRVLGGKLEVALTGHGNNKKGGLTVAGKLLLAEAKEYLALKARRLGISSG